MCMEQLPEVIPYTFLSYLEFSLLKIIGLDQSVLNINLMID